MKGFSLIEIMLVMAIVLTIGFFAGVFPLQLVIRSEIQNAAGELRSALHTAQVYASAGREHSAWGVHYDNAILTLFKGEAYQDREQGFDEITEIAEGIEVIGFSDVIFANPGGRPLAAISGITLERSGVTAELSFNSEGILDKN